MNIFKEFYELEQSDGWDDLFDYIKYESNYNYSFKVAQLPQNRERNRYNNVLPYDHNRIRLYPHISNNLTSPNGSNTLNIQKSQSFAGNLNVIPLTTTPNLNTNSNNVSQGYHSSYLGNVGSGGSSHPPYRSSVMPTKTIRSRWFRKSNTTNSNAPNAANAKFKFSYRSSNTSAKNPFASLLYASYNNNNNKPFNNNSYFNDYINASLLPLTVPRYDQYMVRKNISINENAKNFEHNDSDPFKTPFGHLDCSNNTNLNIKNNNSKNNVKDLFINNKDSNINNDSNKTVTYQYILTQGPLSNTAGHFWAMAWHYKVRCVIMLNKIYEMGSLKCHPYFPGAPTSPLSDHDSVRSRHKFSTPLSAHAHPYASSTTSNASEDDQSATSFEHIDNDTSSSNSHSDADVKPYLPNTQKNLGNKTSTSKPNNARSSGKGGKFKHVSNAKSSKRIMDLSHLTMDLPDVGLSISTLQRDINPDYTITLYELKDTKSGQTRPVFHFQYTSWPDFGVPTDPNSFLAFLARIHSVAYNNAKNHVPGVSPLNASVPSTTVDDKNDTFPKPYSSISKTQHSGSKTSDPIKMTINDLSSDACDMPDNILVRETNFKSPSNLAHVVKPPSPTTPFNKVINISPTLEDDLTPTRVLADESFSKFTTTANISRPSSCTSVYSQSYPIINNNFSKINSNNNIINNNNNTNNLAPCPIIVHCSAGIGRSGTYCLIDYVLNLLNINDFNKNHSAATTIPPKTETYPCNFPTFSSKNAPKFFTFSPEQIMNDKTVPPNLRQTIDLPALLCGMRRYRAGLVQTPDQLRFAYLTILTAIHNHLQISSRSSANQNAAGHVRPIDKECTSAEYKSAEDFKVGDNREKIGHKGNNVMEYSPPREQQIFTPKEGSPCTTSPTPTSTYPPSGSPYFVTHSPKTISPKNSIYFGTNTINNDDLQILDRVPNTSEVTSPPFHASTESNVKDTKIVNSNNFNTVENTCVCSVSSPIFNSQLEKIITPESYMRPPNAVAMPSSQSFDQSMNFVIENVNIANNNKTGINSNNINHSNLLPGLGNTSNIVYREGHSMNNKKDNDGDDEELIFHMETTL